MTTKQLAMPEWLTRKDTLGGAWIIEEGQPVRGDAWTQLLGRRMRIPTGVDQASRVVRGHEMVHAKVSPEVLHADGRYGCTTESLIVAEEYRVNYLLGVAGFDINELTDGSEHRSGEIAGQNDDWNGSVRFLAAIAGTKAASAYIRGVSKNNEKMAESLKEYQKELKKAFRKITKPYKDQAIASTSPNRGEWKDEEYSYPHGFKCSIKLAAFIDGFLISEDPLDDEGIPEPREIKPSSASGRKFAPLVLMNLPLPRRVDGKIGRKRIATNIGYNPRRINRMLTDPEQRVFDRRTKGKGGVVLIDQSGSMSFTDDDLNEIIGSAPGCVVIGYSHAPGSIGRPNVWVIADRGKLAETIPSGNTGNGVDGPAIRFAAKHLRTGEPFIWVCDGTVTDAEEDSVFHNLTEEAASLVVKHRIHMVATVDEAVTALSKASRGERLPVKAVGIIQSTSAWQSRQV
jgi:hypothetical protein